MTGRKTTGDDWRKTTGDDWRKNTEEKFSYNLVVEIITESLQSFIIHVHTHVRISVTLMISSYHVIVRSEEKECWIASC